VTDSSERRAGRHGRGPRSTPRGLTAISRMNRNKMFVDTAQDVMRYLMETRPDVMNGISVDMALLPVDDVPLGGGGRWTVTPARRHVVLYRLPIERLTRLHRQDDWHRRNNIETTVFEAIAELVGVDPYDLAPGRYFPHA
jgi:Zincin-like metallopeptidase